MAVTQRSSQHNEPARKAGLSFVLACRSSPEEYGGGQAVKCGVRNDPKGW